MRIVIFAGGVGTRLWPLSRKNQPKQFGKIIGDESTLQQTVHRLTTVFDPSKIYVATGKRYKDVVLSQLPEISTNNFIFEPEIIRMLDFFDSQIKILLLEQTILESELARTASRLIAMDQAQSRAKDFISDNKRALGQLKKSTYNARLLETLATMSKWRQEKNA